MTPPSGSDRTGTPQAPADGTAHVGPDVGGTETGTAADVEPGATRAAEPTGRLSSGGDRRGLLVSVLAAIVGGGAAYLAAGRNWTTATTARPAPLLPQTVHSTGSDLVPWASAAALVGIAGGLALLATRGRPRAVVSVLVALAGIAVIAGGITGLVDADTTFFWPMLCLGGGALVLAAGAAALARSRRWAAMGARYDAPAPRRTATPTAPAEIWDALDRGDDPTQQPH